jgi:hypothetical protein
MFFHRFRSAIVFAGLMGGVGYVGGEPPPGGATVPVDVAGGANRPTTRSFVPPDLDDPAFSRYVNPEAVAVAWERLDPAMMTDIALQLCEGERCLLRPHKSLPTDRILELSVQLCAEKRSVANLDRLAKAAKSRANAELSAKVAAAKQTSGAARAVDPTLMVNVDAMCPTCYEAYHGAICEIQRARLTGDTGPIDRLEKALPDLKQLEAPQRGTIHTMIQDTRKGLPAPTKPDRTIDALTGRSAPDMAPVPPELVDLPYKNAVNLMHLGRAWDQMDPVALTDSAIQLMDGERVLQRPHKAIDAETVFKLAVQLSAEKRSLASLDRLQKAAQARGDQNWLILVTNTRKLADANRDAGPAIAVQADLVDPEEYAQIRMTIPHVIRAKLTGDARALAPLEEKLPDLPENIREQIEKVVGATRQALPAKPIVPAKKLSVLEQLRGASRMCDLVSGVNCGF